MRYFNVKKTPDFNQVACPCLRVVFFSLQSHRCLYFSCSFYLGSDASDIETVTLQGIMGIY